MIRHATYTYRGMNQDTSKSGHNPQFYFEGQHIKLLSTDQQSTGNVSNEKGNELIATIPSVTIDINTSTITYGDNIISYISGEELDSHYPVTTVSNTNTIIGHSVTRNGVVLFTTNNNGVDCIWYLKEILNGNYDLELLYVRDLEFSTSNPIQAIFNYENENIQKVYWVDGLHLIRSINITHEQIEDNDALIDLSSNTLEFVGNVNFSQPQITDISTGGTHTAGMIQYAYNLYNLNASQTKLSPLSELVALDKGNLGGGTINEEVGAVPVIRIEDIDQQYQYIRVYAVKYTSYNQTPEISLIEEAEVPASGILVFYDDGSSISNLSLEEFVYLGSDPVVPQHIETKDNNMFLFNITDRPFVLPDELDMRAYSFPQSSTTTYVYDTITTSDVNTETAYPVTNTYNVPLQHDSINLLYDTRRYQYNSTTEGGSGKYVDYELYQDALTDAEKEDKRFFKDREIYRIGIQFYNSLGQVSLPKWIADFKAPTGNLLGNYNMLKVTLNADFYTWLATYPFEKEEDIPVGYKIIRAKREERDKTILCQGVLSSMMVNSKDTGILGNMDAKKTDSDNVTKMPNFLIRMFEEQVPLRQTKHLEDMQFGESQGIHHPYSEVQLKFSERKSSTYQYTSMQQLWSPDVLFGDVNVNNTTKLKVIGAAKNTYTGYWGQERLIASKGVVVEGKCIDKLSPHTAGGENIDLNQSVTFLMDRGLISETNGTDEDQNVEFNQWYREFNTFLPATTIMDHNIYGTPELTIRGQGRTFYNNDPKYEYTNSLEGFLSDGEDDFQEDGNLKRSIVSLNSYGNRCVTMVLGADDSNVESYDRTKLETINAISNAGTTDNVVVSELVKDTNDIYFSAIYDGNTYEDRKRTSYVEIGNYNDINVALSDIQSPGDTFVDYFKFTRIGKTDTEVYSLGVNQVTEIVSFLVETSVDLKNRSDVSFTNWDSRFQPGNDEYHDYNTVYSQQANVIENTDVDFTFRRIKQFDTRIQATKGKIPNEAIDSWTDLLTNETMDLDGKYGPINGASNFKDNIYVFQDEAISMITINPRIQVQGQDSISLELGTGGLLYDYNYLTTSSGSVNKWSIKATKKGVYYYDLLNKSIGRVADSIDFFLSDKKGLHSFLDTRWDYDAAIVDNPILKSGVVSGYDMYNQDVYFTFHLNEVTPFTLCFNEGIDEFVDLKTYKPSFYINKGKLLITPESGLEALYEHYRGDYNVFYGQYQPSYVTLIVNPPEGDCTFNNIHYQSEVYLDGIDQPTQTLTDIQAYNEYQDSGLIELRNSRNLNLRRKFRNWKANIPRDGRDRIRNSWAFIKLNFRNEDNYKLILHDTTVYYNV